MNYFFHSTFLAGIFIIPLTLFAQEEDWQLKKEADGITVYTRNPVLACLGSQYAGWSLSH